MRVPQRDARGALDLLRPRAFAVWKRGGRKLVITPVGTKRVLAAVALVRHYGHGDEKESTLSMIIAAPSQLADSDRQMDAL